MAGQRGLLSGSDRRRRGRWRRSWGDAASCLVRNGCWSRRHDRRGLSNPARRAMVNPVAAIRWIGRFVRRIVNARRIANWSARRIIDRLARRIVNGARPSIAATPAPDWPSASTEGALISRTSPTIAATAIAQIIAPPKAVAASRETPLAPIEAAAYAKLGKGRMGDAEGRCKGPGDNAEGRYQRADPPPSRTRLGFPARLAHAALPSHRLRLACTRGHRPRFL
jgi:hypothetical protein